jgi:hypothetical protein
MIGRLLWQPDSPFCTGPIKFLVRWLQSIAISLGANRTRWTWWIRLAAMLTSFVKVVNKFLFDGNICKVKLLFTRKELIVQHVVFKWPDRHGGGPGSRGTHFELKNSILIHFGHNGVSMTKFSENNEKNWSSGFHKELSTQWPLFDFTAFYAETKRGLIQTALYQMIT